MLSCSPESLSAAYSWAYKRYDSAVQKQDSNKDLFVGNLGI